MEPSVIKRTPEPRPKPTGKPGPFSTVDFLMKFRWIVIIPIVLPLSFLWAKAHLFQIWFSNYMRGPADEESHRARVASIASKLKSRTPDSGLICSARPSYWSVTQRRLDYKKSHRFEIDLSQLNSILSVSDTEVRCEPNVSMGQLTSILLPRGVMLLVVPEYDDLTVGGLIAGYGVEGSSHKYGLFADTVTQMELLLANGDRVVATRDNEYKDLFFAVQWSQGTIAILVSATIQLQPCKPYVRLTYVPVIGDTKLIGQEWEKCVAPSTDQSKWHEFQEGLVFDSASAVLMYADYADAAEALSKGPINPMATWHKPWFFKYVQTMLSRDAPYTEYVPTRDYFHRHTSALYWECELLLPFGNHPFFRYLLGWLMPPRVSFLKLTTIGDKMWDYYNNKLVAQDVLVPMRKTAECLEVSHDLFDIYPIWLNAHKIMKTRIGHMIDCEDGYEARNEIGDSGEAQMYSDVGIWSTPAPIERGEIYNARETQAALEQWLIKNHGYQALYAVTELSENDFWKMFDKKLYDDAREKYKAKGAFMDIYYKVHRRGSKVCASALAQLDGEKTHTNGHAAPEKEL